MNPSTRKSLSLGLGMLLTSVSSMFAQMQPTEPVGLINWRLGNNGTDTYCGLGLTQVVEYQGAAESIGANTVTDTEASWVDNQFNGANGAYFIEILSGPGAGMTYSISGTSGTNRQLTLSQNLAVGITAPLSFKIRKHWTIASIFGPENEAGFTSSAQASTADQILRYDRAAGANRAYYYQVALPAAGGTGWRLSNNAFTDASNTIIQPGDGLWLKQYATAPFGVMLLGQVKTGQTSVLIWPDTNIISNVCAADMTLASSGLYTGNSATGVKASATPIGADKVRFWNGAAWQSYYYQLAGSGGGEGWRQEGSPGIDVGSKVIPIGSSINMRRGSTGFYWVIPQHPTNF